MKRINMIYDAQELYEEVTLQAKIAAQVEVQSSSCQEEEVAPHKPSTESAIILIEVLFPQVDARKVLESIELKMVTLQAIGHQYKVDNHAVNSRYKDTLLMTMGEILLQLKPYEIIIRYLYPHLNQFFNNLTIWYMDYTDRRIVIVHA